MRARLLGIIPLLFACILTTEPGVDDEFELRVGERETLTKLDLWVRFLEVPEDSRCPTSVVCVWAGDGAVVLEYSPLIGDSRIDTLHTTLDPKTIDLGALELVLVRLDPYPDDTTPIPEGDYRARFVLRGKS
jgi:hypothetical protein